MRERTGQHNFLRVGVKVAAFLAMTFWLLPVRAAGVRHLSVTYADRGFIVAAELVVESPQEDVFRVLADYGRWHRLNHSVVSSHVMSADDGHHRIRSLTRACLLFFCKDISQTQDVTEIDAAELIAVTVPEAGSLRQGLVRWRVEREGGHARVLLSARLVPDFWIPPLIGPWSIKAELRSEVLETADNLERLAAPSAQAADPVAEPIPR